MSDLDTRTLRCTECPDDEFDADAYIDQSPYTTGEGDDYGPAYYENCGYWYWRWRHGLLAEHRLLAIADGADPYKVFGDNEYRTHHRNGCSLDNRRENLTVIPNSEHRRLHASGDLPAVEPKPASA